MKKMMKSLTIEIRNFRYVNEPFHHIMVMTLIEDLDKTNPDNLNKLIRSLTV